MAEIGQICGSNSQLRSAPAARNVRVQTIPVPARLEESIIATGSMKLPPDQALREVARRVTDYIATNRLTDDEGYRAFKAELVSDIPSDMLAEDEMRLIQKLSQALLDQMVVDPLKNTMNSRMNEQVNTLFDNRSDIAVNQLEQSTLTETNEILGGPINVVGAAVREGNDGSGQFAEIPVLTIARTGVPGPTESKLILSGEHQPLDGLVGEAAFTSKERIIVTWMSDKDAATPGGTVPQNGQDLPVQEILERVIPGGTIDPRDASSMKSGIAQRTATMPVSNPFGDSESSGAAASESPGAAPGIGALQPPEPSGVSVASLQGHPSALLRVDLKEILSGKMAELHIRHDEALIISKVAVLIEQVNGLARLCDEQAHTLANSQKSLSTINPALRQFIAIALGIAIDGNKAFTSPLTIGLSRGDDGLLMLDPAVMRNALESNREEAVIVLRSVANSLYDNISLYVDPRLLSRFSELLGAGAADEAERSRNEAERRHRKEKDSLEKRFLEVTLILEESGKLRDWLMHVVESLTQDTDRGETLDEVVKRPLPAVDLAWDHEEIEAFNEDAQLSQEIMPLFVAYTARALEEDIDASIKLLLKRKSFSEKILADRPALEPRMAMICLANEELVIEKIEAERRKLFASLDELARTSAATRTYRPRFPWPPPMAAFIASEG